MTIQLTLDQFHEQLIETDETELQWDTSDKQDVTYKFDTHISEGWWREIELREGLSLDIDRHQPVDRLIIEQADSEKRHIHFAFMLSGKVKEIQVSATTESEALQIAGKHKISSSGILPMTTGSYLDTDPCAFLQLEVEPEVLRSFAASSEGELPKNIQHLTRSLNEASYVRYGDTQPLMNNVLQQILNCPYQGMLKRMYLESKTIELMALMLDYEIAIHQEKVKKNPLKLEQLERIQYAREILLHDLSNPPSLEALAQRVGLNDFTLRQGFRQAFGTTVFAQLQAHRLEVAKQLLAEQDISVAEVAHRIGYASLSYFSTAFKRKFGMRPKTYQKSCR